MKLIKILNDKVRIRTDQEEFENVRINDLSYPCKHVVCDGRLHYWKEGRA